EHLDIAIGKIEGELKEHYHPEPGLESRLIRETAVNWAKMEFCEDLRKLDVVRVTTQSSLTWDSDQRALADRLSGRLAKSPETVAPALARTKQGADLLMEGLKGLSEIVAAQGAVDEAQHRKIGDLLGVPLELRQGIRRLPPATDGPALQALL